MDVEFSLVIPAYNEEARIEATLSKYYDYLASTFESYELIVVADGCTDRTPQIVEDFSKQRDSITLLSFKEKLGKGGGLMKGFERASGKLLGFTDADESVSPEEYHKLVDALQNGADCAIASRRADGAHIQVKQPFARRFASKSFNLLVRLLFGLKVRDSQCGAKAFSGPLVKSVLPRLQATGFAFDVDLLYNIQKAGGKILEVPITWKHEEGSTFSLNNSPAMFRSLMRIRRGKPGAD